MLQDNLLYLRRRAGLSQEDVAEKAGVSRQTVAKWETGESVPDVLHCSALAELYGVSLDDLVSYQDPSGIGLPLPPKGKYIFGAVTVGERGQIVIPAKARRVFGIKPGDTLMLIGDINQGLALLHTSFFMQAFEKALETGREKDGDPDRKKTK